MHIIYMHIYIFYYTFRYDAEQDAGGRHRRRTAGKMLGSGLSSRSNGGTRCHCPRDAQGVTASRTLGSGFCPRSTGRPRRLAHAPGHAQATSALKMFAKFFHMFRWMCWPKTTALEVPRPSRVECYRKFTYRPFPTHLVTKTCFSHMCRLTFQRFVFEYLL